MRITFAIAILMMVYIGAQSQDYHPSPAYYPIEWEIVPEWTPSGPSVPLYSFSVAPDPKYAGRGTWWQRNRKSFAITGIQLASIVLDASGDALYDKGKESGNDSQMAWGHTLQASAIGTSMLMIPMINWERPVGDGVRMAISYVAMRYALFDLTYNLTRGIDPLYADGVKATMEPGGRAFTQVIFLGLSVSINFTEF